MATEGLPSICFVLTDYDPDTIRHYNHLYRLIDRLAARTDVAVLAERGSGHSGFRSVRRLRVLSWPGPVLRRLELLLSLVRLRWAGYRVFYCHYAHAAARGATLVTRLMGGWTYLWHCLMILELDELLGAPPRRRTLLRWTLGWVDRLVTGSEFMAGYYQRHFGVSRSKVRVVPNFIDVAEFHPDRASPEAARRELGLPLDRPLVLSATDLVEGRLQALAGIAETVARRLPEVLFVVAGAGPYREELETSFRQRGLERNLRLVGPVPNQAIWRYYRGADLFLHMSRFEAFTRTLLEAMAAGVPFVATDGGGGVPAYTASFQQDYILPRERLDETGDRVLELLENPDRRAELARRGIEFVARYDTARVMEVFQERILQDVGGAHEPGND